MDDDTIHADGSGSILNLTGATSSGVTPLEQEVLDEYERLLRNMNQVSLPQFTTRSDDIVITLTAFVRVAVWHTRNTIEWAHNVRSR